MHLKNSGLFFFFNYYLVRWYSKSNVYDFNVYGKTWYLVIHEILEWKESRNVSLSSSY